MIGRKTGNSPEQIALLKVQARRLSNVPSILSQSIYVIINSEPTGLFAAATFTPVFVFLVFKKGERQASEKSELSALKVASILGLSTFDDRCV